MPHCFSPAMPCRDRDSCGTMTVSYTHLDVYKRQQNTLSFRWQQFKRVVLEEDIYMLELREGGRTLLIPRHALGEEKFLLDELIRTVCGKYKLPLDTTY